MSTIDDADRFRYWRLALEMVGIVSIVASLVFLGLQMRQTHEIALATLYQMRADSARELTKTQLESEVLRDARLKADAGAELTPHDLFVLNSADFLSFNHFESSHFLYQQGLLSDEHWESDLRAIGAMMEGNPDLQDYWREHKNEYRPSFVQAIDDRLDGS